MSFSTCDLFDEHEAVAQTLGSPLRDFGGRVSFNGVAVTVRCFEDNSLVKQLAGTSGAGKVMVVDGGASLRCALMGDMIAKDAVANGWEGVVINGAIRDVAELAALPLGIKALGATPRKSVRRGAGDQDMTLTFADARISPGDRIFVDADGVVILPA
jgi:regulator of ribonuclease activity A